MRSTANNAMRVIFTIAFAALCLVVAALPASAEFPGRNGRVTFMRDDEHGVRQVWVATSDLRRQAKLTGEAADSGFPVWAPNGSRIAFDTARADPDPADDTAINDVFTMRPDGSDVRDLTHAVGFSADPAYSPDGRTIVFDTDLGDPADKQGIYLMSAADGSHLRRVTTLPQGYESDQAPRFSPDGEWIEFTRYRFQDRGPDQPPVEQSALFLVRPNGSGLRQITSFDLLVGDGDWSPDGRRIVFETNGDLKSGILPDIYVVDAQGRHLTNITHNKVGPDGTVDLSSDPVWSPDGRLILFLDGHNAPGSIKNGLATMRPDGSDRHFVSPMPQFEHQPDWESLPEGEAVGSEPLAPGRVTASLLKGSTAAALTSPANDGPPAAAKKGDFFVQRANLTQQADGSWSGPGTLDGVKGTVTITGKLDPAKDAVKIQSDSEYQSNKGVRQLHWEWTAGKRLVAGCSRNRIIIRPHGVLLWDGGGRITKASAQERKYRGRAVSLYGPTKSSDLTHAQISIRETDRDAVKC